MDTSSAFTNEPPNSARALPAPAAGPDPRAQPSPASTEPSETPVETSPPPAPSPEWLEAAGVESLFGKAEFDGLPVPEQLRYDESFLSAPPEAKRLLLQQIHRGNLTPSTPPITQKTVRKTVRLYPGQVDACESLADQCTPYESDRRKSLTGNSFLREFVQLGLAFIAPHLELEEVSTHAGLKREMVRALRSAANAMAEEGR